MRLINTLTFRLEEFPDERSVRYAILSHRWEPEEVLFRDMNQDEALGKVRAMRGFFKIERCCRQAAREGLRFAWIDTCCIDKSSSAELQEAINSMFRWYKRAAVCYAYLSDVMLDHEGRFEISSSRWFRRGWTLQELLAPHDLVFYSATWAEIGTRKSLASEVSSVTRVSKKILQHGFDPNDTVLVAEIMSWAKGRKTTRIEDVAYSLLGLFDVYMPMLYGEGARAFIRLQEEILKHSEDQSIFAWEGVNLHKPGLLSPSPEFFSDCPPRQSTSTRFSRRKSPSVTSEGILVDLRLIPFAPNIYLAVLNYDFADHAFKNESFQHGIFLRALDRDNRFVRVRYSGKDLWTGYAFAHKSEAGARLWMDSPTPGRIRKLTAVHRLSDTELMAVNKDPTSIYRVHVDPKFQPDGKFFRHARAGCQGTHRHPEFPIEAGTYGHVGEFAPGGSSNSGCVRGIILGFDFDFSTICMLSLSIYCDNQSYRDRLDFFLSSDINWTPVNDRTINGLQEEASARNVPVCVYSVRNGPIWTTEGGSDVLLLKISNKFGMSDDVVINIDARTADQRGKKGSKGIFSLKISGCCPTDIEVVPFKSDIKHGESRRASSPRDWDEEVECSSEGEDWSRSEVDIGNNDYLRPSRAERALPLRNKQR